MKDAPLYQLNWKDAIKGLIVAVGSSVIAIIQTSIDADHLKVNWHLVEVTAISATIAYIAKNFFTPQAK